MLGENWRHSVSLRRITKPVLSIAWSWGIVFGGLFAAQGLVALSLVLLARSAGPEQYTLYLASSGLLNLLVVLPAAGLDSWLLIRASEVPDELQERWSRSARLRVSLLGVWLFFVVASLFVLPLDRYPASLMLSVASGLAFESLILHNYAALRVMGRHAVVTLFQVVAAVGLLLVVLFLTPGTVNQATLYAVARLTISGAVFGATLLVIKSTGAWSTAWFRRPWNILAESWPFLLSDFAVAVYTRADLTLVMLLLGKEAASVYGPALNLVSLAFMVPNALYLLVTPLLSRSFSGAPQRYWIVGMIQLGFHALVGGMLSLIIRFLAPPIVQWVFGAQYSSSIVMLRHLSLIPFLKALNFGLVALLVTGHRQKQRVRVQLVCAFLNAAASFVAVTYSSLTAVAYVYTASEALLFVGYCASVVMMMRDHRRIARRIDATSVTGSALGTESGR